jgi:hypothetical protein
VVENTAIVVVVMETMQQQQQQQQRLFPVRHGQSEWDRPQ